MLNFRTVNLFTILSIVLATAVGCGGRAAPNADSAITPIPVAGETASGPAGQPPAFPGLLNPDRISTVHRTSETETPILGNAEIDEQGDNNREDAGIEALVIAPGAEDDLAFAVYNLGGLTDDRPIQIDLDIQAAPLLPGGDDPLPLNYWVGLANYTRFSWEWYGPFDQAQSILMNSDTLRDRYVTADNVMYFCMVTESDEGFITLENPDGLTAAQINVSTVSAEPANSPAYNETKPLFVAIESSSTSSLPPKGGSDLHPSQTVTVDWSHFTDNWSEGCTSGEYQVFRQAEGETDLVQVGLVNAPASVFTDPPTTPMAADPVPGVNYRYYLRGHNDYGSSAMDNVRLTFPTLEWTHTWGGVSMDIIRDVAVADGGIVYATGVTQSFGTGGLDLLLLKYDADGTLLSRFVWGEFDEDSGQDIFCDSLGNKYITGRTLSLAGSQELLLLKFDSTDQLVWSRRWTGVPGTRGLKVWVDPTGAEVFVSGQFIATQTDSIMTKLDSDGNTIWKNWWTGPGNSTAYDFAVDPGANVYVTGFLNTATRDDEALLLKFAANGELAWAKTWGTVQEDEGNGITLDNEGNIYICGFSQNWPIVIKLDSDGSLLWQQRYVQGVGNGGKAWNIVVHDGRLFVAGEYDTQIGGGDTDMLLFELNPVNGELIDNWNWGGPGGNQSVFGLESAGNYLVFGGFGQTAANLWRGDVAGFITSPDGMMTDISGSSLNDLTGVLSEINGFLTSTPAGTEDTGGGGSDTAIIQILP